MISLKKIAAVIASRGIEEVEYTPQDRLGGKNFHKDAASLFKQNRKTIEDICVNLFEETKFAGKAFDEIKNFIRLRTKFIKVPLSFDVWNTSSFRKKKQEN